MVSSLKQLLLSREPRNLLKTNCDKVVKTLYTINNLSKYQQYKKDKLVEFENQPGLGWVNNSALNHSIIIMIFTISRILIMALLTRYIMIFPIRFMFFIWPS